MNQSDKILYLFNEKFLKFETYNSLEKLEFINEIIDKFETYNYRMFQINQSPFIEKPEIYNQNIIQMKKAINTFLLKVIKTETNESSYAKILIGISYEYGFFNLKKDEIMAFGLYESISRLEIEYKYKSMALFRQAICFEKGIGTRIKKHKAVEYYRLSAKLGDKKALHVYGSILLYGFLNKKSNLKEASFFLKQSTLKADISYPFPFFDLGILHEFNGDNKYAFECYKKGADLKCKNCLFKLAKCYEMGEIIEKDKSLAIFYYKQSKHSESYLKLSYYYLSNILKNNNKENIKVYKFALKAALNGNIEALEVLGNLYEKGIGVENSLLHSLWWYEIALSYGIKIKEKVKQVRYNLLNNSK